MCLGTPGQVTVPRQAPTCELCAGRQDFLLHTLGYLVWHGVASVSEMTINFPSVEENARMPTVMSRPRESGICPRHHAPEVIILQKCLWSTTDVLVSVM